MESQALKVKTGSVFIIIIRTSKKQRRPLNKEKLKPHVIIFSGLLGFLLRSLCNNTYYQSLTDREARPGFSMKPMCEPHYVQNDAQTVLVLTWVYYHFGSFIKIFYSVVSCMNMIKISGGSLL